MTGRHFLDLGDTTTVDTTAMMLTRRAVADITRHRALGVVHGSAGLGKTFAVEHVLGDLDPAWTTVWLSFPSRPTMRLIAQELHAALTGGHEERWDRFKLSRALKHELSMNPCLVVVDEAQNLNREGIEFLRHLGEDPRRRGAMLLVGGDGCWDVLSREPMLRSRVFRRVALTPMSTAEIVRIVPGYHPIYAGANEELIRFIDLHCGHGNFRNWASFTLSARDLCHEVGRTHVDEQVARNVFALLGGGVGV